MSFNPAAKQATAATATKSNAVVTNEAAASAESPDDAMFKIRTFDLFWVDKSALMYRDGFAKVREDPVGHIRRVMREFGSEHIILFEPKLTIHLPTTLDFQQGDPRGNESCQTEVLHSFDTS
jgi:hypothetical protein